MDGHPETDLGVYVLGVLPGAESTRLRLHLETCAACRTRVGELEGISELLSAARLVPDPPPGLVETALASLPPRRPPDDPRPPAPGGGTVGGDFVVVAHDAGRGRRRRRRRLAAVAAATAAVVGGAALAWALLVTAVDTTIELESPTATVRGRLRVDRDGAGSTLVLRAAGLAAGEYAAALDGAPAGSFRVSDGVADVDLHAAASTGRFVVRRDADGSTVLEADVP